MLIHHSLPSDARRPIASRLMCTRLFTRFAAAVLACSCSVTASAQDSAPSPQSPPPAEAPEKESESAAERKSPTKSDVIRVRAEHPRVGPELSVTVQQPIDIAPYYRADLFAPVTGTVEFVQKSIGHSVRRGEVLIRLQPAAGQPTDPQQREILAPFDGVVASRSVDPGAFVTSAVLIPGAAPLMTIVRDDILTAGMRVPDTVAALIAPDTEAEIKIDGGSTGPFRCTLTRIAPGLSAADRTRRVEVDLWNGTPESFALFEQASAKSNHQDLKGAVLPQVPRGLAAGTTPRLLPGMYGQMRLTVQRFKDLPLIPSSAIVRRGGMPYLFRVEGNASRLCPITIDIDDGTLASVAWLEQVDGAKTRRPIRTDELIVVSNQGELENGSAIEATVSPAR
ncbi:MAG: HlyD family efflux transporter periplasmic adaptor subunit [Planctomycetes bacterium]|nr:HlyD family efflux transporter periplasmic adaptor subunit [Planctomycetota bacterium]